MKHTRTQAPYTKWSVEVAKSRIVWLKKRRDKADEVGSIYEINHLSEVILDLQTWLDNRPALIK